MFDKRLSIQNWARHGEKLYEVLLSREEMFFARRKKIIFIEPDLRDLNYSKYFEDGSKNKFEFDEYNSQNTKRLLIEEMAFAKSNFSSLK